MDAGVHFTLYMSVVNGQPAINFMFHVLSDYIFYSWFIESYVNIKYVKTKL